MRHLIRRTPSVTLVTYRRIKRPLPRKIKSNCLFKEQGKRNLKKQTSDSWSAPLKTLCGIVYLLFEHIFAHFSSKSKINCLFKEQGKRDLEKWTSYSWSATLKTLCGIVYLLFDDILLISLQRARAICSLKSNKEKIFKNWLHILGQLVESFRLNPLLKPFWWIWKMSKSALSKSSSSFLRRVPKLIFADSYSAQRGLHFEGKLDMVLRSLKKKITTALQLIHISVCRELVCSTEHTRYMD